MTNKNDALFLVSLPFGKKTVACGEVPALIAKAKSSGYDCENASEHEDLIFVLGIQQEEDKFKKAVRGGEVEVLDKSFHRIGPPFIGRLENALLTVQAFREYLESIHGFLEVGVAPEPQKKAPVTDTATPAPLVAGDLPDTVERFQVKRRTWRDVAWPYVVETFKAGQYSTAKDFYRALENKAGASDSPFEKGTGVNIHSLYVREISETVTLKTIQNAWADIKASR